VRAVRAAADNYSRLLLRLCTLSRLHCLRTLLRRSPKQTRVRHLFGIEPVNKLCPAVLSVNAVTKAHTGGRHSASACCHPDECGQRPFYVFLLILDDGNENDEMCTKCAHSPHSVERNEASAEMERKSYLGRQLRTLKCSARCPHSKNKSGSCGAAVCCDDCTVHRYCYGAGLRCSLLAGSWPHLYDLRPLTLTPMFA